MPFKFNPFTGTLDYYETSSGGSGAEAFTDLTDVPSSYSGEASKFVKVKATEDGLEFVAGSGASVAWGDITGTLSGQTDLQNALDAKVDENVAITGATKTKITYDAKGLVTAGVDATTADISDSLNKRYVTDAQLTVIGNTSGTNTGDQVASGVAVTPTGNLASSDVQAGLQELQGDIDTINSSLGGLTDAVVLKGLWDASSSSFPGSGSAQAGWSYIVSVAGTVDGVTFEINDRLLAITDNASTSTYSSNWHKLDYTDQVLSVNSATGAVVLDADDIDDSSTSHKFVTSSDLTKLSNTSGTNTGDQTSIVGITGTKAEFDTAVTDGNFLFVGDVTQYTDEMAQDAVGGILVASAEINLTYSDITPSITASLIAGSIDEAKLDVSVNASLDLADSALQAGDNISTLTNDSGYITASSTNTLTNKSGNISQWTNDSGYLTDLAWGSITGTLASQTDLQSALNGKQDTLVSGTNIKTINGSSILGSGDLAVSASVTNYSSALSSDVNIASSDTWYDTVSLSLPAGTYLVNAHITFARGTTTATRFYGRITDKTNHYASGIQMALSNSLQGGTITLTSIITLGSTTTIYAQGAASSSGATTNIVAQIPTLSSDNTATIITAIKL